MSKRWVFFEDRCKGCALCVESCPEEIIFLSDKLNTSGYRTVDVSEQEDCISCGFCARTCPDVAIEVYRPEKKSGSKDGRDKG